MQVIGIILVVAIVYFISNARQPKPTTTAEQVGGGCSNAIVWLFVIGAIVAGLLMANWGNN